MSQHSGMAYVSAIGESVYDPAVLAGMAMQENGRKVRNVFTFSQLTNVVRRYSQMGEFHVCKHPIFEIVKLKKDAQKCL